MTSDPSFDAFETAADGPQLAYLSDTGMERELNEDCVWAGRPDARNPWQISAILAVADGMGGHHAGEIASGSAMNAVRDVFLGDSAQLASRELMGQEMLVRISDAFIHINRLVRKETESAAANGDGSRPGTTLTVCLARPKEWFLAHAGDSRAYLIPSDVGAVKQLSQDDSYVGEAIRAGWMTEEEARVSPFRNQITKAVGLREDLTPSVYYGHWDHGDYLLLCSDGLTEYVSSQEMADTVRATPDDIKRACEKLIALANQRGGADNISIAIARRPKDANAVAPTPMDGTLTLDAAEDEAEYETTQEVPILPVATPKASPEIGEGDGRPNRWIAVFIIGLLILAGVALLAYNRLRQQPAKPVIVSATAPPLRPVTPKRPAAPKHRLVKHPAPPIDSARVRWAAHQKVVLFVPALAVVKEGVLGKYKLSKSKAGAYTFEMPGAAPPNDPQYVEKTSLLMTPSALPPVPVMARSKDFQLKHLKVGITYRVFLYRPENTKPELLGTFRLSSLPAKASGTPEARPQSTIVAPKPLSTPQPEGR